MSLIMGVLDRDFVLFCGDTQLNKYDGTKEETEKIFKINEDIIIGIGGDAELSHQIIDSILEERDVVNLSFEVFESELVDSFNNLINTADTIPNVSIISAGIIDGVLSMRLLAILDSTLNSELISYISKPERRILGRTELHIANIKKFFNEDVMSREELLQAFQNVVNEGMQNDTSINNIVTSCYLKI